LIDAIVDAPTPEAAIAATRKALELSGVVITDDPAARRGSTAWMYLSTAELETMAAEAQQRATLSRTDFREFTMTLAGMAVLPADTPAGTPAAPTGAPESAQVKVFDQPGRWAAFTTEWVRLAEAYHQSGDAQEVALTNAPLLFAALARRQADSLDLREPFLPGQLLLGSLDLALFIAGIRATLLAARADVPAPSGTPTTPVTPSPSPSKSPSGVSPARGGLAAPAAAGECEGIFKYLEGTAPRLGDLTSYAVGTQLKGYVGKFVQSFTGVKNVAQRVSVLFSVLGIIFRVQALLLLYESVDVKTEVSPSSLHKGRDVMTPVTAKVTAGVPDYKWNKFKTDNAEHPIRAIAKACAKSVGLPVTSNLGDIASAMKNWHVRWDITNASAPHAEIPGGQFFRPGSAPGRLENQMKPEGDHKATDSITVNIKPEKDKDHPGEELEAPVTVCSWVRTDPPPSLKTLLSGGISGSGVGGLPIGADAQELATAASGRLFGPAAIASLTAVIADLLASFFQNLKELKSCGKVFVSYHKPKPGKWTGTISIEAERSEDFNDSQAGSTNYPKKGGGTITVQYHRHDESRSTIRFSEDFRVGGDAYQIPGGQEGQPVVALAASQSTSGFNEFVDSKLADGATGNSCLYTSATVTESSGNYSYTSEEAHVTLHFAPDGTYGIDVSADSTPAADLSIDGTDARLVVQNGDALVGSFGGMQLLNVARCKSDVDSSRPLKRPIVTLGIPRDAKLAGQLDPNDPGDRLSGSVSFFNEGDGSSGVVRWDLRHEGPIRLPSR
jgi:hypothetical protein